MGVSTQQPFLYRLARQLAFRASSREMGEILADYREFSADPDFSQPPKDVIRGLELSQKRPRRYAALAALVLLASWWLLGWFVPHCGYTALRWAIPAGLGLSLPGLLLFTAGKKGNLLTAYYCPTAFDRIFPGLVCLMSLVLVLGDLTGLYPRFQLEVLAPWIGPGSLGSLHRALTAFMGATALLCVWLFLRRGRAYLLPACWAGAAFYMLCAVCFLMTNMNLPPNITDTLAFYISQVRSYAFWALVSMGLSVQCRLILRKGGGL